MSDEKQKTLEELHDLMARTVAMMTLMEEVEYRVAALVEGGRQQLAHLVEVLKIKEIRAELRSISNEMAKVAEKL